MATVSIGKICVYAHLVDGKVVYIGKGMSQRPYEIRSRTARWRSVVGDSFEVEVLAWFDTDTAAREFETTKIRELRPSGNYVHTIDPRPPRVVRLGGHGGKRAGAGRPPLTTERCACGKHTLARAVSLRLKCRNL